MAIIPSTGPVTMTDINNEFGKGLNLYAYRGVKWYRPDNSRGVFDGLTGNNPPIDFDEFRGKVGSLPIVPTGDVPYANGSYFTFPNYNKITVVVAGGQGGQCSSIYYNGAYFVTYAGGQGGTSSFGSYGSSVGGAGGGNNSGSTDNSLKLGAYATPTTIIFDADNPTSPLKGISVLVTVGDGGAGGSGAGISGSSGAKGSPGYVTIKVE